MRAALDATTAAGGDDGRPVVYSVHTSADLIRSTAAPVAQLWRTTPDIQVVGARAARDELCVSVRIATRASNLTRHVHQAVCFRA